ncbi:MAG: hypothetical protein VB095_04895 [Anaerovorax sp.]|nr:hypothetical protein [Anaerovorax sp.]
MKIRRYQPLKWVALFTLLGIVCLLGTVACKVNQQNQYEMEPAFLKIGEKKISIHYVVKIDGKEVSLEEYRYHFLNMKDTTEDGNETYFLNDNDGTLQRRLKSDTMTALKEVYAIEKLAKENHLTLSQQEEEKIDNDIENQVISLGSVSAYKKALQESYMTNDIYRKIWKTTFYYEKLYQHYYPEDKTIDYETLQQPSEEEIAKNEIKLQAMIAKTADSLIVEYAPEYDLISVDTLY